MSILFIADLHLTENKPKITENFLQFIDQQASQADALYILGDFFEVWVGDDNQTKLNHLIIQKLKLLTSSGVKTYIMHGNRDFLIGKKFLKKTGCLLLPDPSLVNLYNIPVLLTHGDILCAKDIKYQKYRKKIRNRLKLFLFLLKPLEKRQEIATNLREMSKARNKISDEASSSICQDTIDHLMLKFQTKYLIHGHLHQSEIKTFEFHDNLMKRIVLGNWNEHTGNVLICSPNKTNTDLEFKIHDLSYP